jgi:hypothetical protein
MPSILVGSEFVRPRVVTPDALKWAPDASGAHWTHTERVWNLHRITERGPPDTHLASDARSTSAGHTTRTAPDLLTILCVGLMYAPQ